MRYLQIITAGMMACGFASVYADDQGEPDGKKFPSQSHEEAYKTLSTKNKATYDALPQEDQDRVTNAHKEGASAQEALGDILADDQDDYDTNAPSQDEDAPSKPHADDADDDSDEE